MGTGRRHHFMMSDDPYASSLDRVRESSSPSGSPFPVTSSDRVIQEFDTGEEHASRSEHPHPQGRQGAEPGGACEWKRRQVGRHRARRRDVRLFGDRCRIGLAGDGFRLGLR